MKNDVVRWNANNQNTRNNSNSNINNNTNNNDDDNSNNRKLPETQVKRNKVAKCCSDVCLPQHVPATRTYGATTNASQRNNQCDTTTEININLNDILLINNNSNNNVNKSKTDFLTHKLKSSQTFLRLRRLTPTRTTRTRTAATARVPAATTQLGSSKLIPTVTLTTRNVLLCILQFSAVVFLYNLNLGFVAFAAARESEASTATSTSASASLSTTSPLFYALDYEQPENGSGSGKPLGGHYTHTWAVHIPHGDDNGLADEVAREHGFVNLGKIFDDHYHFAHHKVSKRSLLPATHHQTRLDGDERVHWAKQQTAKSRRKRDFIRMRPSRTSSRAVSLVDAVPFDDPKWPHMWYLNRGGGLDMNVIPAWKQGITGKGIVVTILDDGLESDHPDIEKNYDPKASYDVNSHDDDPMPHYDMTDSNRHGTRCAGEVAATANNSICAVGIAYGASVGGVRMLDGDVTDAVEARSLSLNPQHIDIYSASWGPDDDGKTVDGPGELASRAFIEGTTKGRNGKGSIFIWASGNGGRELDNCNCDGYTNSIWTLSISSATEEGHVPWYSEKCSSTLATTYSSGGQSEKQVVTTDLHHSCTVSHTGTSASAPLAAGIAALVLESNQNLTWRDLQHIVVRTAKPANLKDPNWSKNGVGRRISHSFGYGLMDASEMVRVARIWKTVPEQQRCEINAPHVDKVIPPRMHITLQLSVKHCLSVNYLEHVQAKITLTSQRRGDIQLYLKSPAGTKVTLLTSRMHDLSRSGFNQWPFMSVHTWGESPHGNWQLEIHNEGRFMGHALLREWSLIFYGTTQPIDPADPVSVPRSSSAEITTPNSSIASTTTNLHQIYSPQYPRISPNNFGGFIIPGSKLPIGKMPPNKSIYVPNGSTINPLLERLNLGSGSGGGGNNKKQQGKQQTYQQISATYGVILGSHLKANNNNGAGKGNKASKGKNSDNNNKPNKNQANNGKSIAVGGNNNKKDITTQSTPKNKYYRISQQQQQQQQQHGSKTGNKLQNGVQTPRQKSAQSAEKYYEEKINRKVIGEIGSGNENGKSVGIGNGGNNNAQQKSAKTASLASSLSSTTLSIMTLNAQQQQQLMQQQQQYSKATAMSYAKLPIKATKQVKDSQLPGSVNADVDQRIPKLFERYEKIQAIFPEFEPYESAPKATKEADKRGGGGNGFSGAKKGSPFEVDIFEPYSSNNSTSSSTNGRVVSGGGGGKPSRENSKKSPSSQLNFMPDQKILKKQQLLMAAAGVLSADNAQRALVLNSNGAGNNSNNNNNRKSTNAQITQWDLIFYGTEKPAQPDDPVHLNVGQFSSFGNDLEHNDFEFDASGQWRNMQQVGESGLTRDRGNTAACLIWSDQKCLACAPTAYSFNSLCYDACPLHTYPLPLETTKTAATTTSAELLQAVNKNSNEVGNYVDENGYNELQAQDRRRRAAATQPNTTTMRVSSTAGMTRAASPMRSCAICDRTCLGCHGPSAAQCSSCYPGSQLRVLTHLNESHCFVYAVRSSGDIAQIFDDNEAVANNDASTMPSVVTMVLVILLAVFAIGGAIGGAILYNRRSKTALHDKYTRVALMADEDEDDDDDDEKDDNDEEDDNDDEDDNDEQEDIYAADIVVAFHNEVQGKINVHNKFLKTNSSTDDDYVDDNKNEDVNHDNGISS